MDDRLPMIIFHVDVHAKSFGKCLQGFDLSKVPNIVHKFSSLRWINNELIHFEPILAEN